MSDESRLLTDKELAAVAERAEKASPEPWTHCVVNEDADMHNVYYPGTYSYYGGKDLPTTCDLAIQSQGYGFLSSKENAEFIAAARSDIPALLAGYRRMLEWCRRFVACGEEGFGPNSPCNSLDLLLLLQEVRSALESAKRDQS